MSLTFGFKLQNFSTIKFMKSTWFGGLRKIPIIIDFNLQSFTKYLRQTLVFS